MNLRNECPRLLGDFLSYHETVRGHTKKTTDEYFLDLRLFFRFLKMTRGLTPPEAKIDEIPILDVDLDFIKSINLSEIYDFLSYLSRERSNQPSSKKAGVGLGSAARARKVASIRSFFKYLVQKAKLLEINPTEDLDSPKLKKSLPRYLSLDESIRLLDAVRGKDQRRDYCMLTLFLNCGLRISELVGINVGDIKDDALRVTGKGNKERIVYLNEATLEAISDYLKVRNQQKASPGFENALFLSKQLRRISTQMVHVLVKKHLSAAGLDSAAYSSHKLRHTSATLMLQNGVDVRTLQEVLGHEHLNTTQIYVHVDNSDLRTAARANPLARVKKSNKE